MRAVDVSRRLRLESFFHVHKGTLARVMRNRKKRNQRHGMNSTISLCAHNELYVIDCNKVMYMQADDHYTHVYYLSGNHFMVPYGLSTVMGLLDEKFPDEPFLIRVGRTYVINTRVVFHINTVKQIVVLADSHGNNHSIHLPKQILRDLIESLGRKS